MSMLMGSVEFCHWFPILCLGLHLFLQWPLILLVLKPGKIPLKKKPPPVLRRHRLLLLNPSRLRNLKTVRKRKKKTRDGLMVSESRPEGLPPSQGGKYVRFGSTSMPTQKINNSSQGDVFSVVSQGIGRLSLVAASAANVVQAGTKEFTSKVKEGGYDARVNETVSVVIAKTSEIGQKTWGIMKGVMEIASQKVEEYTKYGLNWKNDGNWQRNDSEKNGYYQEFKQENKGWNSTSGGQTSSGVNYNSHNSNSGWTLFTVFKVFMFL
ncbi:hypothetical protein E1A91_D08G123200v1 [Gossypium mustelinum]|uniref:Senescence domain-containing protein n=2 Tax=Gossypium TaxID=3633 RepID=A0A5D2TV76_GOSMU|nr:hypothetical protein E1A91_D08G123200v1 [Gossypium mustelinum]